ncbi:MAG: sporulation protein YabP [Clostridia bacterium]|nr:sporulation protein YabP [Clostridia bacterium]
MSIEERKSSVPKSNIIQNLILESREKLNITGALDVLSFDDQLVIVQTHLGLLTVKGEDLRISKLNIDSEEVIVDGEISTMSYSDKSLDKKENSFFSKIFK